MSEEPKSRDVLCPECNTLTIAMIPAGSTITSEEANADGKVQVTCHFCEEQFLAHYQFDA